MYILAKPKENIVNAGSWDSSAHYKFMWISDGKFYSDSAVLHKSSLLHARLCRCKMFIFYFLYLVSLFTTGFSEPQPTDGLSVGCSVTWDGIIAGHGQHVFITISEPDIIHTTQLDMHQLKKETRQTCLFCIDRSNFSCISSLMNIHLTCYLVCTWFLNCDKHTQVLILLTFDTWSD